MQDDLNTQVLEHVRAGRRVVRLKSGDRDSGWTSPNFMGLGTFGLEIGMLCDFLYIVFLLNAVLGLDFLGLALSWQVLARPTYLALRAGQAAAGGEGEGKAPLLAHDAYSEERLVHGKPAEGDASAKSR